MFCSTGREAKKGRGERERASLFGRRKEHRGQERQTRLPCSPRAPSRNYRHHGTQNTRIFVELMVKCPQWARRGPGCPGLADGRAWGRSPCLVLPVRYAGGVSNGAHVSRGVGVSLTLDITSTKTRPPFLHLHRHESAPTLPGTHGLHPPPTAVSRMVLRSSARAFALLPLPDGARRAPYAMPRCGTRVLVESDDLVSIQVHRCLCTSSTTITLARLFRSGPS
jgi:hypothetical protein